MIFFSNSDVFRLEVISQIVIRFCPCPVIWKQKMDYNYYQVKLSQLLAVFLVNYDHMIDAVNIIGFKIDIKVRFSTWR